MYVPVGGNVKSSAVGLPAQIEALPEMLAVGVALTVTRALPVMFACGAVTPHNVAGLVTFTIVYVTVDDGATETVALLAIPVRVKFVVPSVYITSYVPAGSVNVRVALEPEQSVADPLMLAVGNGLSVIRALPVMLGLGAVTVHVVAVFVTLTMVYVVLTAGLTITTAPLLIPFAVKLVVPSV